MISVLDRVYICSFCALDFSKILIRNLGMEEWRVITVYVELLVSQIFGDSLRKCNWRDFYWQFYGKETHVYSLNGVHLIWQYLSDTPNQQIKATVKYTMCTVYSLVTLQTKLINGKLLFLSFFMRFTCLKNFTLYGNMYQ